MNGTPSYLSKLLNKSNLTKEQEQKLAAKIDQLDCEESKNILFESNLRLVLSIARKYSFDSQHEDDLFNEGCIGLWQAVESFKPIGFRFSSFASHKINSKILAFLAKRSKTVYIPVASFQILRKIKNYIRDFVDNYGHEPTCKQISEDLDISLHKVELLCNSCDAKVSFDKKFENQDSNSFYDIFVNEENSNKINLNELQSQIIESMKILTEKERMVIEKRFGINSNSELRFKEIGSMLGLTKQRVEQINKIALDKLKKAFVNNGVNSLEYI